MKVIGAGFKTTSVCVKCGRTFKISLPAAELKMLREKKLHEKQKGVCPKCRKNILDGFYEKAIKLTKDIIPLEPEKCPALKAKKVIQAEKDQEEKPAEKIKAKEKDK